MIFSEWNSYNLDEVYDFSSGLSKSRKEFGFGYPYITFKDVFYNFFIPNELTELANTTEKERINCSVERGDVFLTRTSETLDELGQSSVALKTYPNATFNGFTKRLRPNGKVKICPEYAGYYFRSPNFRAEVTSMSTMTTRASLNNDIMSRLKIVVPSLEEQKSIAKILLTLDEKIEINNQINKKLEEMAQAIFKQWFVDFEFPNEDGKPYKSSGGEMVESEMGIIPKGWKICRLGEICEVKGGKRLPKGKVVQDEKSLYPYLRVTDVTNGYVDMKNIKYIDEETRDAINRYIINYEDLYISIAGTIGLVGTITKMMDKASLTENMARIITNDINKYFIKLYLNSKEGQHQIFSKSVGSTQPKLPLYGIKDIPIIISDKKIEEDFSSIVNSIFEKIEQNLQSSYYISELRDTLLPKLMSGEIRVPINN